MKLHISISDKASSGNYLEGGFDKFSVIEGTQSLSEVNGGHRFNIYPNPGAGTFKIKLNEVMTGMHPEIRIMDLTGRVLYSGLVSGDSANNYGSENLAKGVYLVAMVIDGKVIETIRYIKSH